MDGATKERWEVEGLVPCICIVMRCAQCCTSLLQLTNKVVSERTCVDDGNLIC